MLPDHFPRPPQIVEGAIYHWLMWLDNLPKYGPVSENVCGSAEKGYAHITRKLQAQYHPPEIRPTYDFRLGERFEGLAHELDERRYRVIRMVHYQGLSAEIIRRKAKARSEDELCTLLRNAYDQLAAKLSCPN